MKSKPFELVPDDMSTDTIRCLQQLLEQAEAGNLIGICFAAMLKRSRFIVNSAGEAHRSPVFSRGMVQVLDDHLARRIRTPQRN